MQSIAVSIKRMRNVKVQFHERHGDEESAADAARPGDRGRTLAGVEGLGGIEESSRAEAGETEGRCERNAEFRRTCKRAIANKGAHARASQSGSAAHKQALIIG